MKKLIGLTAWILVFSSTAWGQATSQQARILDSFHEAAADADSDSYLALLTDDMVFLGTDGSERWQGEVFRQFVRDNFNAGRGWRYTPQQRDITVSADSGTAWFDEMLTHASLGLCRGSGVLVKTDSGWKIAQYNLSVPVPNELVMQVVADIAAMDDSTPSTSSTHDDQGSVTMLPTEAETEEEPEVSADTSRSANCSRRRHKTNRKAGC